MNADEHLRTAELQVLTAEGDTNRHDDERRLFAMCAQVHAILAIAAALGADGSELTARLKP